jgi:LysM repeat protein
VLAVVFALMGLAPATADAAGKSKCEYTVKKGDTVSRIARRIGVSEANLVRANPSLRKNPDRLRVGQALKVCRARELQHSRPQKCDGGGRIIIHKVGKGETLGGIAARYSVSRDSVRKYNKQLKRRSNSMIRVGERLRVCTENRRYTHRSWLKEGVQLEPGEGYNVRRPANAWGRAYAVAGIAAAVARYREREPDAPLVQIGDISRQNGGPLRAHLSHQDGRDVDIGYVFHQAAEGERRKLDIPRSWALLRSFVDDPNVAVIFVDYRLQKRLYEHAKASGVEQDELDRVFEYPRGGDEEAILYHWRGHTMHFHVRFRDRATDRPRPGLGRDPELASAPRRE